MEFRILGSLEVVEGDQRLDLGGPKQRALLAALLLRANEVVSQDALVDDLWGETPPATATKTLSAYVSRLRKSLASGDGRSLADVPSLETRGRGYVLRLPPGSLDADEFQRLLEEGRAALARDAPKEAADLLRQSLVLWRGSALADLAYESFAQVEIARLDELRLGALEERIEADLALGRHSELVAELESLVEQQPLRERLRGQLMLALYRANRQAQALEVYRQGRQLLSEELGLQPSEALQLLERQILEQNPALRPTRRRLRPEIVPAAAWRHPRRLVAAGVLLLVAATGLALWQLTRDGGEVAAAGTLVLDPGSGDVQDTLSLGSAPATVTVGEGSIWILDGDDKTVTQIDPATRRVERVFGTTSTPTDIAAGAGGVWIGNAPREGLTEFPASVTRIDPETGVAVATIDLPPSPGGHAYNVVAGFSRQKLAASRDAVWVVNPDQSVSRIDPRTNRRAARIEARAEIVAVGEGDVWLAEGGSIAQVDTTTNTVSRRISVAEEGVAALAVGAGSVWVADPLDGSVWRVDSAPPHAVRRIPLERWVNGLAFGAGAVWATNEIADEVYRIDPRKNEARVVARTASPRGLGAGEGAVWVAAASPPSREAGLPSSACGELVYDGPGEPELLLVSDLPLKGWARPTTVAMVEGVRQVLEQRGYEAGGYTVGFQACDPSTAQSGDSDFFRCGSNAKAYARELRVIGVFGSFQSPCTYLQLPIANRATGGPLAMISPSNTHRPLTLDEGLYPTGTRNFVRIAAADHLQAVGHAELLRQLGADRAVVVAARGDDDFATFARNVATAARRLGIAVTTTPYEREARDLSPIVREIVRARPDAVAVEDVLIPESARLVRELRRALPRDVEIVLPDGFGLYDDLIDLVPEAEGIYVTQYGIPNGKLPLRGRQFLRSLELARGTSPGPDFGAAYGGQAAEILLDAIARSDGTRASVTSELFRTRVEAGILGDIRFDRNGDLVDAPVAVFRMARRPSGKLAPVADRVVVARSALLREPA